MGDKTKPKKGKKKVVIIVLVVLIIVVAVIGNAVKKMTSQVATAVNTVEVEPVQKRDLSDTISLKGTVSGITKNNVTSKALAEITAVNVQVGDIVKEGDVLCTLDSSTIKDQVADLERDMSDTNATNSINSQQTAETVSRAQEDQQTQLAAAQKAIDDAKDAYNAQSIMWDKSEDKSDAEFQSLLAAQKAVTTAEEDYQKVLETTNRTIEDAQLAVELDKYKTTDSTSKDKLTDLKEQLADCNITAPCGGVVTAVNVSVGDVNADSKTALVTIEDTSSLKMVATVEEADILKIEEGMKATVTADAMGDETINGTVTRVVRVKGQSTGSDGQTTTSGGYSVEISLDNTELLIGMEVKAKVMIKERGNVLAIPYDLVKTDDDGNSYVLIAQANDDGSATALKKNITVGEEVDYYTEVTGGDLAEGDKLIYDYSGTVTEGQQFTPAQMYSEQDMGTGASTDETSDAEGMSTSVEGNE
jgi:HlyD family secretion protein